MSEMVAFCLEILQAIPAFLMSEPIFYLFSLICFGVIIKIVLQLLNTKL